MLNFNDFAHHLNSDHKIEPLYLKRVLREIFLLSTPLMSESNLASRDRLSFLKLFNVTKLESQSIAPSW